MSETIKQAIRRARTVLVLVHPDYTDFIAIERVEITKREARWLVDRAPDDAKPTADWNESKLCLLPAAYEDRMSPEENS